MMKHMSKTEKKLFSRVLIAGALFFAGLLLRLFPAETTLVQNILFIGAYLIIGYDVIRTAAGNIIHGQVFDECFLMTIATFGAFGLGDFAEGTAVMLFYQVGELFQSCGVTRSRRSIAELMDIRPDQATLLEDGKLRTVSPEEVNVGDTIVIRPGERIPLDGIVSDGASSLDTSALTGESVPRDVAPGDSVISGCVNLSGMLTVRVSHSFGASTVSKILELVESAADKKSPSEQFITRFARYYTPVVVISALLLAVLPPLIGGQPFALWFHRALIFLVISCPCALVISVPLSFFGGIGGASRAGILVKGSNYLEALAQTKTVVFDKTGTLTEGSFSLRQITPSVGTSEELLHWAAYAESHSTHPIAQSVLQAYGKPIDSTRISSLEELPGYGVRAVIDGKTVLAGNARLMEQNGIPLPDSLPPGTVVHLARNATYLGYLLIADQVKADAAQAIQALKEAGIEKTIMLTGDMDAVGQAVGKDLGLDEVYTQLLPGDKLEQLERLLAEKPAKSQLAYVGDGINDAPVLARADVGIAMGGLGSDAAIEAADVVLMTDEPYKLVTAIKIGRKTLSIAWQNIIFALGVKALVLVLGALGFASMWTAVFADVGVSIIAILNALRALRVARFLLQ